MFIAITTEGEGLVKSDSQPDVNPQYYVRPLSAVPTLDGMPTNPKGYPAVSPAEAFDLGKESGASADLDANKEVTIDVSTYSAPVEVEPTEGKDGMEKATITLTNIPEADLEENKAATIDVSTYTEPVEVTPTEGKDGMEKATITLTNIPQAGAKLHCWVKDSDKSIFFSFASAPASAEAFAETYRLEENQYGVLTKVSNSDLSSNYTRLTGSQFGIGAATYLRSSSSDISVW